MLDDFIRRRNGQQPVDDIIPETQSILRETYGLLVYREKIFKVLELLASYSMAEAELFFRCLVKRVPSEVSEQRGIFLGRAEDGGMTKEGADRLFDQLLEYGCYMHSVKPTPSHTP